MLRLVPIVFVILIIGSISVNDGPIALSTDVSELPDEDCLFDPSLAKCSPGPEGCPEGFAMNAYEQCFPRHEGGCPEGYHSHEDDESG